MNNTIEDYISGKYVSASEIANPITLRIEDVHWEEMKQEDGKRTETKPVLYFKRAKKGLVLNKTNATVIANAYGTEPETWNGQRVTLHVEPVQAFGKIVDAIRVRIPTERPAPITRPAAAETMVQPPPQTMQPSDQQYPRQQPPAEQPQHISTLMTDEVDEDDIPF